MFGYISKALKWSSSQVKKKSIFKASITLTHKSRKSCIPFIASMTSLAMMIFLVTIGVILFIQMIRREQMQWNQNVSRIQLREDKSEVALTDFDDISIRFTIRDKTPDQNLISSGLVNHLYDILALNATLITTNYDDEDIPSLTEEKLQFKLCSKYDFVNSKQNPIIIKEIEQNLTEQLCLNFTENSLAGNEYNRELHKYIQINSYIHSNFSGRVEDKEIYIYQEIQTKYVDLDDYEAPIKYYYTDYAITNQNTNIIDGFHEFTYKIKRNSLELEDHWWDFLSSSEEREFNSVETNPEHVILSADYDPYTSSRFNFRFQLSEEINQYGRRVTNFLEVTGTIGGLFEILDIIVGIIIGYFYSKSLKKQIGQDLYKANKRIIVLENSIQKILKMPSDKKPACQKAATDCVKEVNKSSQEVEEIKELDQEDSKVMEAANICEDHVQGLPSLYEDHKSDKRQEDDKNDSNFIEGGVSENQYLKRDSDEGRQNNIYLQEEPLNEDLGDTDDFIKNNLDCVDLIFQIKELQLKTKYLLSKDAEYLKYGFPELYPSIRATYRSTHKYASSDKPNSNNLLKRSVSNTKIHPGPSGFSKSEVPHRFFEFNQLILQASKAASQAPADFDLEDRRRQRKYRLG
ncbi:unnamed protein product [Moneuplotes crassus]|uniref:Uncharacterized protein n=1 Tax=Euplotes crassus TaxID=5936 RepID=A0AAD1YAS4_EUPCR|nr:unnamed protein product [Moneuplotes crassus]